MYTLIEFFCGTKSISKEFTKLGFNCITVDNEIQFEPDICSDIQDWPLGNLPQADVIWMSPPCTKFSVAQIGRNWNKDDTPKNQEAADALMLVHKAIVLKNIISPKLWFIENPVGKLRKLHVVRSLHRDTVTYCSYGHPYMKPTDIWHNSDWIPRPMCKRGMPCHIAAPRGSQSGTQGSGSAVHKGIIPPALCKEIAESCLKQLNEMQ